MLKVIPVGYDVSSEVVSIVFVSKLLLPGPLFMCRRQLLFVESFFGGFAAMVRNVCIEGRELFLYMHRSKCFIFFPRCVSWLKRRNVRIGY